MTTERQIASSRRLLRYLDEQRRRVDDAWQLGYQLGHADGWAVGHDAAHDEVAAEERRLALIVRKSANSPKYAEIAELRRTPGGDIYAAAIARRGYEYKGGPIGWETGRPLRRTE